MSAPPITFSAPLTASHPYPVMVRNFQRVIGDEARRQILEREKRLPDLLIACVGGGTNAIGLFYPFLEDPPCEMLGVEAGGEGIAPENMPRVSKAARSACFKARDPFCSRTKMARSNSPIAFPPGSITLRSVPNTVICARTAGWHTILRPTTKRWPVSNCYRKPKESFPPSKLRMPSRTSEGRAENVRRSDYRDELLGSRRQRRRDGRETSFAVILSGCFKISSRDSSTSQGMTQRIPRCAA